MSKLIKNFLDRYVYLVPPICVIASLLSKWVTFDYVIAGNSLGYSILISVPLFYHFWFYRKYCWFTKLSTLALPLMNIVCLIGYFLDYQKYLYIYEVAIVFITVFLSFILALNKNLK